MPYRRRPQLPWQHFAAKGLLANQSRPPILFFQTALTCRQAAQDRRNALAGIDILRKICNHPDLLQRAKWEGAPDYGNPVRSGKLTVAMKACAARPPG